MRRLTAWIGGVAAGVVAYRFWRRRPQAEPASPEPTTEEQDDRADELRAKLAETRAGEDEPSPAEPDEPPEAVEERRRRVHEEGRSALDEMKADESA
jgi:hypothetical protein